jgi:hypothetical protein
MTVARHGMFELPLKGTNSEHYTLWDPTCLQNVHGRKTVTLCTIRKVTGLIPDGVTGILH